MAQSAWRNRRGRLLHDRVIPRCVCGFCPTFVVYQTDSQFHLPQSRQILKAVPVRQPVLLRLLQEFVRVAVAEMEGEAALSACESNEIHRFSGFWIGEPIFFHNWIAL
jgi:hypothetical protein